MIPADPMILVRGGGDLATGSIYRLWRCGFRVLVLETAVPMAVRRRTSVCEAVFDGTARVEDLTAVRIRTPEEAPRVIADGKVPVLVDPDASCIPAVRPDVVIDAIVAKKNFGTNRSMAPLTIALGPGFTAGVDVDYVIETMRGHNLGRIISRGRALENTGVPGLIAGHSIDRVIHAPASGTMQHVREIGDLVEKGEIVAWITPDAASPGSHARIPVYAPLGGVLRGMIRDGYPAPAGWKIGDVDPRLTERKNCFTISDKSRCIAGSVLEIICREIRRGRA